MNLPLALHATKKGLSLAFTELLDSPEVDVKNVQIKTWSLKRTANYGSKHYDEEPLEVRAATLSSDGKTVMLEIPDLRPTWCMEIKYSFRSVKGAPVVGVIHNTIHQLAD